METNKELIEAPADLGGDIFDLIREWAHRPEGQRGEVARSIIGVLNRSYMAGVKDTRELFALSQRSEAVPVDDYEAFATWKGYPLPALNSDGQFPDDWMHREYRAYQAGRRNSIAPSAAAGEQVERQAYDALLKDRDSYKRMFEAACVDLGLINEKLGLDPDDGGAEPIIDAIDELLAAQPTPAQGDAVPVAVRRALELYADSYDMMARIGKTGDVDCKSVAFDIRKNMVDSVIDALSKATDATRQSSADAVDAALISAAQAALGVLEAYSTESITARLCAEDLRTAIAAQGGKEEKE